MRRILFTLKQLVAPCAYVLVLVALAASVLLAVPRDRDEAEQTSKPSLIVTQPTIQALKDCTPSSPTGLFVDGVARPARVVELASPINGPMRSVHPALELGGVIPAGEPIWRIEDREYAARLEGARQQLAEAVALGLVERGRARAASREWTALGLDGDQVDEQDRQLALRVPQGAEAEARIARLRSAVTLAQVDLDRCTHRLAFDLEVLSESIEPGAWVEQGQLLVTGMRAGEWHILARLTPAQAESVRLMPVDSTSTRVTIIGSLGESLSAEFVRWLPGELSQPQMRGVLLRVKDVPGGVLWDGAQVHVDFHARDTDVTERDAGESGFDQVNPDEATPRAN